MVIVAGSAERIAAALRTAVRANNGPTVGALRYSRFAARHTYVAVTVYMLDLAEAIHAAFLDASWANSSANPMTRLFVFADFLSSVRHILKKLGQLSQQSC